MAVNNDTATTGPLYGDGSNKSFPFDFIAASADEVAVYVDGLQLASSAFSVALEDDGTGTVTTVAAPANGAEIYLASDPSFQETAQFERYGPYFPDQINPPLDRAAIRSIYLRGVAQRALLAPIGEVGISLPGATARANKMLAFDGAGNALPTIIPTLPAPNPAYAGLFLAYDAGGNPVASSGTGADAGLRTDLAATNGGALVKLGDGATAQQAIGAATDVPSLLATTASFVVGSVLATSDAWKYKVVAPDATDYHLQTSGGSKLKVIPVGAIWNVRAFGAKADGSDDTLAIQTAINAVAVLGGKLYFPAGTYLITDALVLDTGSGAKGIILEGDGISTIINQTGVGKDGIQFSTTKLLSNSGIRNLQITCSSTSGHCVNVLWGITNCFLDNVSLTQNNPAKQTLYNDSTSAEIGTGIYNCVFRGGTWSAATTATGSGMVVIAGAQRFVGNLFANITCYNAKVAQFFNISCPGTSASWLENNRFENIIFERSPGGGIAFDSARNWIIDNCSFQDSGATEYVANLIQMRAGGGTESQQCLISRVARLDVNMASGFYDIQILSGQDTEIRNVGISSGRNPKYDFGSKRVSVYGRLVGTVSNDASTTYFGNSSGQIKFPGASVYLSNYDEGTFTATLSSDGTVPGTPVTTAARWTRIGRIVTVGVAFSNIDNTGYTGSVVITGLPVAVNSANDAVSAVHMIGMGSIAAIAKAAAGTSSIILYRATSATKIGHADGTAGAGKTIILTMTYTV